MKNINKFYFMYFFLIMLSGHAQFNSRDSASGQGDFKNLHIGYSKTTSIVFPYAIRSIDKGSGDILMQKAKGVENILLLKAAKENFTQTNITVVTSDNRLYVFLLNYDDICPDLNIKADKTAVVNDGILFSLENENQKEIEQYAQRALFKKKKVSGLQYSEFGIQLSVNGLFIHQDLLFFRVVLSNNSKINYDIDQFRFFIRDQKKSKRTASQEIEILPLYCTSLVSSIPDKSELTLVYAVSKFTIPEKKYLTLQLMEKNGGRNLEINIKNKDLVNLEILNSF